jgi:hypothetical protein
MTTSPATPRRVGRPAGFAPAHTRVAPLAALTALAAERTSICGYDEHKRPVTASDNARRFARSFLADALGYVHLMRHAHDSGAKLVQDALSDRDVDEDSKREHLENTNEGRAVLVKAMAANARLALANASVRDAEIDAEAARLIAEAESLKGQSWAVTTLRAWAARAAARPASPTPAPEPAMLSSKCSKCCARSARCRAAKLPALVLRLQNLGITPSRFLLRDVESLEPELVAA